jgi:HlyD family secretion protein
VTSQQQLDLARATSESAAAQVNAEQATINQAQAQVAQKAAALQVSQTNLSHTTISAPIDGVVVARNVDVGQTVAASLQAPTLFTIAQDLTKMQVYTKTDESDVGQIRPGQKVTFKVDAFPRDSFTGRVSQVRMNATTVQNVVTYDTIIDFDNPDTKLFPGMTAYVSIPVAAVQDVVKIPNGALRFKPDMKPEEIRALYSKYGIESGRGERAAGGENSGGNVMAAAPSRPAVQPGGGGDRPPVPRRLDTAIVWKLKPDNTLEPVQVRTGITDRTFTQLAQVLHGALKEGDLLVTGSSVSRAPTAPGVGGRR